MQVDDVARLVEIVFREGVKLGREVERYESEARTVKATTLSGVVRPHQSSGAEAYARSTPPWSSLDFQRLAHAASEMERRDTTPIKIGPDDWHDLVKRCLDLAGRLADE